VEFNSVHAIRALIRGSLRRDTPRKGQPSFCCHAGRVHVALANNNVWRNRRIFMKIGSSWTPQHHMSVHFQISRHSHTRSPCFTSFALSLFALTSFSWLSSVPPTLLKVKGRVWGLFGTAACRPIVPLPPMSYPHSSPEAPPTHHIGTRDLC